MSHITTHILDTSLGKPAVGVIVKLQEKNGAEWQTLASGMTNSDGRVADLLDDKQFLKPAIYRMLFETGTYYKQLNVKTFYPEVGIVFETFDQTHYHVPLLLNPFGFSTYRGS